MRVPSLLPALLSSLVAIACGQDAAAPPAPALAAPSSLDPANEPAQGAAVILAPTQGHTTAGRLVLVQEDVGVRIRGEVTGLQPDREHAFHVHETGDCSAPDAASAGAHFNPFEQPHGNPATEPHHAGDMLNLRANSQGVAQVDVLSTSLTLGGTERTNALGKALIVHANPDDYRSQPAGNAGDRLACGVIE